MTPSLKDQLVAAHRAVFAGVLDAVANLDAAGWETPTGCPGWDVGDQLAHVVGIERLMLGDPPDEVVLPDDLAHVVTDFDRVTEQAVQARRGWAPGARGEEAREVFARRLVQLDGLDPDKLREPLDGPGGMRMKASQMLRTRVFDMTCHEQDIRRALGRLDGLVGPHVTIAAEQVLRAWARTLPGRLGDEVVIDVEVVDLGLRVRLDLSGTELVRDVAAGEVAGRRWAAMRLDAADLLAVGTGRRDAPGAATRVVAGDATVLAGLDTAGSITP